MCCTPSGGSSNDTRDNCATLTSKTSNVDGLDRLPQDHEQHGFTPVKPTTAVTTTSTAAMAVAITLQLRQLPRKETIDNTGHHYDGSRSLSIHSQTRSKTSSSSFGRCQTPPSTAWMKGFMGWCFWSWITLTLLESDFGHCHFRLHCYYCQALTTTSPPPHNLGIYETPQGVVDNNNTNKKNTLSLSRAEHSRSLLLHWHPRDGENSLQLPIEPWNRTGECRVINIMLYSKRYRHHHRTNTTTTTTMIREIRLQCITTIRSPTLQANNKLLFIVPL